MPLFTARLSRLLAFAALFFISVCGHRSFADEPTDVLGYSTIKGAHALLRPDPIPARFVYGVDRDWHTQPYRLAVLLVEFSDTKHKDIHTAAFYDQMLFSHDQYLKTPSGAPSFGSVADWYRVQSNDRFVLTGKVFDWVTVDETFETIHSLPLVQAQNRYLKVALAKVRTRDGTNALDGFDGYLFVHVGPITGPPGNIFWSHRADVEGKRYVTTGEIEQIGVICHEFGHVLGLPDLYAKKGERVGFGPWCTMASGYRGTYPKSFCVWSKTRLGWCQPTVVDASLPQKLVLRPIQSHPNDAFLIPLNASDGVGAEFLLLENRAATGNDAEGQVGLFIWRIVRKADSGGFPTFSLSLPGPADEPDSNMNTRRVAWPTEAANTLTIKQDGENYGVSLRNIRKEGDQIFFEVGPQ